MICTMCAPRGVTLGNGAGWVCICGQAHCRHVLRCVACNASRYALEKDGLLKDGRPVLPVPVQPVPEGGTQ